MSDTEFPDISEFEAGGPTEPLPLLIVRAWNGYRADRLLARHAAQARQFAQGRLWYGFLVSDVDPTTQAHQLLAAIPASGEAEGYMVDSEEVTWAPWSSGAQQRDYTATALEVLTAELGRPATQYSDVASLNKMGGPIADHPLVVAGYGIREPGVAHTAWQFTDGRYTSDGYSPPSWPGLGKTDTSVFHGDAASCLAAFHLGPGGAGLLPGIVAVVAVDQTLEPGAVLCAGTNHLVMQGDGNLVLYGPTGNALWNAGTAGHPGAIAVRTADGNLVVYSPIVNDRRIALWQSAPTAEQPLVIPETCMITSTPLGGSLTTRADGSVFAEEPAKYRGGANEDGDGHPRALDAPIVGIASTPTGGGYWQAASDGGVFAFGDAKYEGSLEDHPQFQAGGDKTYGRCVGIEAGVPGIDPYVYRLACDGSAADAAQPRNYDFPAR